MWMRDTRLTRDGCLVLLNGQCLRLFFFLVTGRRFGRWFCNWRSARACIDLCQPPAAVLDEVVSQPNQRAQHHEPQQPEDGEEESTAMAAAISIKPA